MAEDYYKTLGINKSASSAEIQKAFRDLARKYHPDMNLEDKNAKAKFQKLQQAYEVLNDPEKREMYDRYGSSFESMGAGSAGTGRSTPGGAAGGFDDIDFHQFFGGRAPGNGASGSDPFGEMFKQFTGAGAAGSGPRGRSRRGGTRGADIRHDLTIPFQTAISGGEAAVTVRRPSGKAETLTVKLPPGIEDGKTIRLRGQGEETTGPGIPGDLLITVHLEAHPFFQRNGQDLEVNLPVTILEAAQGARVDVPTPKGTISLKVPANSSTGKRLRIKGHGVPSQSGAPGDLYAIVQLMLPEAVDETSLELLRKFNERSPSTPRASLRW